MENVKEGKYVKNGYEFKVSRRGGSNLYDVVYSQNPSYCKSFGAIAGRQVKGINEEVNGGMTLSDVITHLVTRLDLETK